VTPQTFHIVLQGFAAFFGLALGSFLNVCIGRMPEDRSVVSPPSHCPACGHQIRWFENIPVLSWVFLRARCSGCGTKISPLYPTIELLMGVLALLLFRTMMPEFADLGLANGAAFVFYLILVFMLVGGTYIDLRHYIIPDEFTWYAIPPMFLGVLGLWALGYEGHLAVTPQASALGTVFGGGVLLLLIGAWWLLRRVEAMGFGDVKLLALIGCCLGAMPVAFVLVLASLVGSVAGIALMIRGRGGLMTQLPFGPCLSIAAIVYVYFGDALLGGWMNKLAVIWAG
jgi:leader peptidase (prepilin peptidase)/N-methyltransferase